MWRTRPLEPGMWEWRRSVPLLPLCRGEKIETIATCLDCSSLNNVGINPFTPQSFNPFLSPLRKEEKFGRFDTAPDVWEEPRININTFEPLSQISLLPAYQTERSSPATSNVETSQWSSRLSGRSLREWNQGATIYRACAALLSYWHWSLKAEALRSKLLSIMMFLSASNLEKCAIKWIHNPSDRSLFKKRYSWHLNPPSFFKNSFLTPIVCTWFPILWLKSCCLVMQDKTFLVLSQQLMSPCSSIFGPIWFHWLGACVRICGNTLICYLVRKDWMLGLLYEKQQNFSLCVLHSN